MKKIENNKLLVILGPTASGKTTLALKIAKKFRGEVVSADSRQIYKGMDIGTAKPRRNGAVLPYLNSKCKNQNAKLKFKIQNNLTSKPVIANGVAHWLIDIKNPNESYTVAEFKDHAVKIIKDIQAAGKLPILCGGTGLYVEAVTKNLDIPRVPPNPELREKLERELQKKGTGFLYKKLVNLDPEAAYIIDPKNGRRIIRALEVMLATNRPFTSQRRRGKPLFKILQIGISRDREELNKIIDKRVDQMIKRGLVREVRNLTKKYPKNLPAFDAIGYREIIRYLDEKNSLDEAVAEIKKNTRRFARRQMSWFRRDKTIKWVKSRKEAERLIKKFLQN